MIWDHSHIFWDCPVLQGFWQSMKGEVKQIINMDILLDPVCFTLGETKEVINKDQTEQVYTMEYMTAFYK